MKIQPTDSPTPKYPALTALAVAAAMLPACQQVQPTPQPLGGAPLPPPTAVPQQLGGTRVPLPKPKKVKNTAADPQRAPGVRMPQRTPGRFAPDDAPPYLKGKKPTP